MILLGLYPTQNSSHRILIYFDFFDGRASEDCRERFLCLRFLEDGGFLVFSMSSGLGPFDSSTFAILLYAAVDLSRGIIEDILFA
jgi:hypothetical protein